jgi:hypothetical protein
LLVQQRNGASSELHCSTVVLTQLQRQLPFSKVKVKIQPCKFETHEDADTNLSQIDNIGKDTQPT